MNTFIVHPQTEEQQKAVKAILEALNVDFEMDSSDQEGCVLPNHIVEQVKKSDEQFKNGQYYTHEEVMNEFRQYL